MTAALATPSVRQCWTCDGATSDPDYGWCCQCWATIPRAVQYVAFMAKFMPPPWGREIEQGIRRAQQAHPLSATAMGERSWASAHRSNDRGPGSSPESPLHKLETER